MISSFKHVYRRVFLGASIFVTMGTSFATDSKVGDISVSASGNARVIGHAGHVATDSLTQNLGGQGGRADNTNIFQLGSPVAPEREKKPHEYFTQAEALINKQPPNWDEAVGIYMHAADAEPPHMIACIRCAEYYQKQVPPKISEALNYYTRALSAQGVKDVALRGLMKLHHAAGVTSHREAAKRTHLNKAKEYGEQMTMQSPDDESILDNVDSLLSKLSSASSLIVAPAVTPHSALSPSATVSSSDMIQRYAAMEQKLQQLQLEKEEALLKSASSLSSASAIISPSIFRSLAPQIPAIARGYEDIYQRFLKGVLVYRPDPNSENGKIDLPIAALANPLDGIFDLSKCGDTAKYLSIATGYRKGKKAENANKVEVWIAPRFLVEKELSTTAKHFNDIMANWPDTAPVGLFWTWGGWDNLEWMDYLTHISFDELGKNNLYDDTDDSAVYHSLRSCSFHYIGLRTIHFILKNE